MSPEALPHSGSHSIDIAIRTTLASHRTLSSLVRSALRVDLWFLRDIETADEDKHHDVSLDAAAKQKHDSDCNLRAVWRRSKCDVQECEMLADMLVSPEQRHSALSAADLLSAQGGLRQLQRTREVQEFCNKLTSGKVSNNISFVRADERKVHTQHTQKRHSEFNGSAAVASTVDGRVSLDILQRVLRTCSSGGDVHLYAKNALSTGSQAWALPREMFTAIMRRLRICAYQSHDCHVNKGSGSVERLFNTTAAKVLHDDDALQRVLCLDRLLFEGVVRLNDKSLVVVSVLYGIHPCKETLLLDEFSGVPRAGLRFMSLMDTQNLLFGWTIVVYDVVSETSRAIAVSEKDLEQFSVSVGVPVLCGVALASSFAEHAKSCLRIARIANRFVGLSIDFLAVVRIQRVQSSSSISKATIKSDISAAVNSSDLKIGLKYRIVRNPKQASSLLRSKLALWTQK
jgi:hypothetical protein